MNVGALSRTVWAVSLPLVFAEIGETVVHVTDTAFLGRVGTTELAAVALADSIFEVATVVVVGLVEAIQIVVARRVGQGRDRDVGATFNQGLLVVTVASVAVTVALVVAAPVLTPHLVSSPAVGDAVSRFLRLAALGIVFYAAGLAYGALHVALGRTRVLLEAGLVLALTNVVLDYVLIFGKLGLPALGIEGAALSFVGAELATFVFLTVATRRRVEVRRYGLFELRTGSRGLVRSLTGISSPVALQLLVESVGWFGFFLLLERLGEDALARSNLVYSCFIVFLVPTVGFGETACSMVSQFIGSGRAAWIGTLVRRTAAPAYLVTLPLLVVAVFLPGPLLALFTSDPAVADGAAASLRVVALAMLVVIPGELWHAAVSGTGDTAAALVVELVLAALIVGGGYVAAFVLDLSLAYVWTALPLAWLVCLLLSHHWVQAGYWSRLQV